MKTFYGRKPGVQGPEKPGPFGQAFSRLRIAVRGVKKTVLPGSLPVRAKRWIAFASLFTLTGAAYSLTRPINWRPLVTELSRTLPEPLQQLLPQQKKTIEPQEAPDPTRTMAPQGAFPLQRGMALVSRLSNPNAGAPGQGSDRKGFVLGVYDARNPGGNSAPAALGNWNDVSNTIFRHPDWTNAKMGEVFGIEIDNSVPATPQVFVGSTGTFVGYINGSAEYAGRTIPATGSEGGDVFRVDGNTGNVSTITNAIPSTGYHTSGGRGASAMTVPLNTTAGRVKTVAIVNGGTGYALFDPLVFTGGTGTGAAGYVTVTAGVITGIVVTNQGTGYGPGPLTVSVTSAGGGTGFTGTVTMGYPLQTGVIVPTSGGAGYPFLGATIMGDGVGGGVSTAFTTGSLTQYNITVAGLDYTYAPTVTINNRYTGVGNIGYNYAKKVVYTTSLDNGNIYAIDATTGTFLGAPFNHQPGIADPSLAVTDLRRLAVGMAWNPRDNRLYFSRPDAVGYTTSGTSYNYTHNEVVSIGLNADGSINTSDVIRQDVRLPVTALQLDQRSLITDIEFTSDGNIALLGEMSTGNSAFRFTTSESRFTKGSHNAIAREYRFDGSAWSLNEEYHVGNTYSGYNNTGGADFGYGNSENPEAYYDAAVLTGDYIEGSGFVYGIQVSPLSQGNYPTNTPYNHYIIDDNTTVLGLFVEKTGIGDVDVFSGVDYPAQDIVLALGVITQPTDCGTPDGIITITGEGLLPNTPYPVTYVKDGGAPVSASIVSNASGIIEITGLPPGAYTGIQINDPPTYTSNILSTTLTCSVSLSGTVFNDVNGLNPTPANTVDGVPIQSPSGTALHANLFTDAGAFVATTPIDGSGNYVFNNVTPSSTYIVTIGITPAAAGSTPAGSVGLPASWFNTGENVGLTAGSDGTVDGILQAVVATVDLPNVNFGIEQGPETAVNLQASQPNPGGTTSVTVPANAFVTSNVGTNPNTGDPAPGAVTGIIITGFPSNATSITIDGNVYTELTGITDDYPQGIPTDASGQPTVTIQVDPADGAVSVVIPIAAIDAAGVQDATPGSITLPFTVVAPISLSGTVFNDVNGLNPTPTNTVDGIPIQSPSGTALHANLFTDAGAFVATTPIDGSGNYVFNNVTPSSTYIVTISTTPAAAGSTPAGSVGLPESWFNTGEHVGLTAGSDGTVDGILQAVVATVDLPNVNFGIEQGPETAVNLQTSQPNPGGTTSVTVPASAFVTSNVGTNPNTGDPAPGAVTGIVITGFPGNATSITIDGNVYTELTGITDDYPQGIPTDATGQPTVTIQVDPADGAVSVVIPIAAIDAAGVQDATPGSITLPFTVVAPISLSGTVFNDVNGLNPTPTNTVDGVPIQSPSGTALHANLFTEAGAFVATTPIDGSGNYVFNNVTPSSTYIVTISTTPAAAGSTPAGSVGLPASWFNTGENVGLTAGSDGTVDGILQAVVATVDLPNVNFGIEQGPETAVNLQASQPNPGGTTSVTVPASAFVTSNVGTNPNTGDPAPGAVTGIIITGFPSNATSITIDGNVYTELTGITDDYPQGIPTDASGQPTVTIQVDPADGAVSVVIPIAAIDAAGVQDATPGSITLPFTVVAPISLSGTVFNDVNGLNPTPANTVDGTPIQSPSGTALHANLFTDAGAFVATTPIDGSGNYVFNNVTPSSTYVVTISITPAAAGSTPAGSVGLPANWVNTGENVGLTAGSDGTVNGILQAVVATVDLPNVNFGIQQLPESEDHSAALPNQPAADAMIPLDGVLAPALSGSDPEDHSGGGSLEDRTILITSLPTNGELWYNGTQITVGDDGVNPVSVINPFTITNLVLSDLEIKLTGSGYTSTSFTYAHVDGAGFPDPTPATYTLTWEDPLPVKLVSFIASKEGDVVQLVWTTSEESNSEYFEVQRSADGKDWKPMSRVNSAGESSQISHYDYTDANPQPGQNLYRLKMVDRDNTFALSGIRSVNFEQVFSALLSPNPTSDVLKITTANWQLVKAIKIYDAAGKLVYNSGNKPERQIDVRGLVSGMHVVSIEQIDGASHAQRIVIVK